jgi:hypothetical protein
MPGLCIFLEDVQEEHPSYSILTLSGYPPRDAEAGAKIPSTKGQGNPSELINPTGNPGPVKCFASFFFSQHLI